MATEESEEQLVARAREGSHSAFAVLVARHRGVVRGVLGRYFRDDNEVDELAQRAFVFAYRSLDGYRGESSFRSWLVSIARRQAAMYIREESRRKRRERSVGETALLKWTAGDCNEGDDVSDKLEALAMCLERLPGHSRELVRHYYFEQRGIEMIARGMDRSRGAVRMSLLRVRQALAKCVSQSLSRIEGMR
ncbi:MAG: sigma-70 family RNA polymerase sigma factor [Pirellulales bacterium]|nr:sigma-70 family RNA polymerase sigma factor [Pirellulales bacterium]